MPKVHVSSLIPASVASVWEYIHDFNDLPKWLPGVVDSHIEDGKPSGKVGCVRNFGVQGGARMREELLSISERDHTWTYRMLEGPLPLSNYLATVRIVPTDDGHAQVEIASEFDCPPSQEEEFKAFLAQTYQAALDQARKHFSKA